MFLEKKKLESFKQFQEILLCLPTIFQRIDLIWFLVFNATFSYIMMTSFSGGRSRREPSTMGKQLVNYITCGCKSSAPSFCKLQSWVRTHVVLVIGLYDLLGNPTTSIRVITKLPNSEQSYKGKVKTHKYINRQNHSTTGKCENRNDPDLVQAFLKKWWVESDFKTPMLMTRLQY